MSPAQHPEESATPGQWATYATICLECPAGCPVRARTREGRVIQIEGHPDSPLTKGGICARGIASVQGLYDPDRLQSPLRRLGDGSFEAIPWEAALRELALALRDGQRTPDGLMWLTGDLSDAESDALDAFIARHGLGTQHNLRLRPERALYRDLPGYLAMPGAVPEPDPSAATLLVSVGADFLETWGNPVALARGFGEMRASAPDARAVYVGPRRSNTCATCDEWIPTPAGGETDALWILTSVVAAQKGRGHLSVFNDSGGVERSALAEQRLPTAAVARLRRLGREIADARAPLVLADAGGAEAETALKLSLFMTLAPSRGVLVRTLRFYDPPRRWRGDALDRVTTAFATPGQAPRRLVLVRANPAHLLPDSRTALDEAGLVIALTTTLDESARRADLVVPLHHPLEDWGYHELGQGLLGIQQPVTRPLHDTRSLLDLLPQLSPGLGRDAAATSNASSARRLVEATIERALEVEGDEAARRVAQARRRGFVSLNTTLRVAVAAVPSANRAPKGSHPPGAGLVGLVWQHPFWGEGRGAAMPWLQEVPDSATSIAWGNWAAVHPDTAAILGVKTGEVLEIEAWSSRIEAPAFVTRGIVPGTIGLPLGQGRESGGPLQRRGSNPLRLLEPPRSPFLVWSGFPVRAKVVPGARPQAVVVGSRAVGRVDQARTASLTERVDDQAAAAPAGGSDAHPRIDWAMAIDLDRCSGCGACAVACYSENHVPVVGEEGIRAGREMAWLRIEAIEEGDRLSFVPTMCQHCHEAPCERACPTGASQHTSDGLNAQIYDRCVGTRACVVSCPYEQRRFNWSSPAEFSLARGPHNPDVRERPTGSAEKCTFCLQRLRGAMSAAKREGRPVHEGEAQTACAAACPTGAIVFGNLANPMSRVAGAARDPRAYHLLDHLRTYPSVWYLARRRRPPPRQEDEVET